MYLLNRLPSKVMGAKTSYEVWKGRKPQLNFLKVFGCKAHVRTAMPHMKKLDDGSKKMVYLGVDEGCKALILLDVTNNKIVVSRDIVCDESEPWDWSAGSVEDFSADFFIEGEHEVVVNGVDAGEVGDEQQAQPVPGGGSVGSTVMAESNTSNLSGELQSPASVTTAGTNVVHPSSTNTPPAGSATHTPSGSNSVGGQPTNVVLSGGEQLASELPEDDSSTNDSPFRFTNLNEIYEDTSEVELMSDSEIGAFLAIMEEPSYYKEAAGNADWELAMDSELKSIKKQDMGVR